MMRGALGLLLLSGILGLPAGAEPEWPDLASRGLHENGLTAADRAKGYGEQAASGPSRVLSFQDQYEVRPPGLAVLFKGKPIYAYTPRYRGRYTGLGDAAGLETVRLGLLYDGLANRAGKPQPKPFDDVLGLGRPTLLINEYAADYNDRSSVINYLTVIVLDGEKVHELPAVPWTGEVLYLRDFDGDGSMEIVNTDWEQGFRYAEDGVPLAKCVWRYDRQTGRYRATGTDYPAPPGTWPAYQKNPPDE